MADKFDPEKFLTEDENDNLCNELLNHQGLTFNVVLKSTFPELCDVTSANDLEQFEEWFLDTYDVHECDICLDWTAQEDLDDGVCPNCCEEVDEDEDE